MGIAHGRKEIDVPGYGFDVLSSYHGSGSSKILFSPGNKMNIQQDKWFHLADSHGHFFNHRSYLATPPGGPFFLVIIDYPSGNRGISSNLSRDDNSCVLLKSLLTILAKTGCLEHVRNGLRIDFFPEDKMPYEIYAQSVRLKFRRELFYLFSNLVAIIFLSRADEFNPVIPGWFTLSGDGIKVGGSSQYFRVVKYGHNYKSVDTCLAGSSYEIAVPGQFHPHKGCVDTKLFPDLKKWLRVAIKLVNFDPDNAVSAVKIEAGFKALAAAEGK